MSQGLDRGTEAVIGIAFLVGMIITFIVAINTFEGNATILLILLALVFLAVALFFLSGRTSAPGVGDAMQSQQQSVVLGGGEGRPTSFSQSSSGVMVVCRSCGARAPEGASFCPDCGQAMGA